MQRNLQALKIRPVQNPPMSRSQRLQLRALKNQQFVLGLPYYSTVRIVFTQSGAGPYTYTMASTEVSAFSYALGQAAPATAGFTGSGLTMSLAETNLLTPHETVAGEELHIRGIAAQPAPGTDARLAALVWRNCGLMLTLNGGQNRVSLGPLSLVPGGGGLTGAGPDDLGTQPIPGGRPTFSALTNGWPVKSNLMTLDEGFVWRNKSKRDGQLALILQPAPGRSVTATAPAIEAAVAGTTRGYTPPTAPYVDILFWLAGTVKSQRSRLM